MASEGLKTLTTAGLETGGTRLNVARNYWPAAMKVLGEEVHAVGFVLALCRNTHHRTKDTPSRDVKHWASLNELSTSTLTTPLV